MKPKALAKRLEKSNQASFIISFRIPRSTAVKLAEIQDQIDLPYDTLTRLLFRSLIRHWDEHQSLELPIYVALMTVAEARRRRLLGANDNSDGTETSD